MEPDETPNRPGAYTAAVMNRVSDKLGRPLTPPEREAVFETILIVEDDLY